MCWVLLPIRNAPAFPAFSARARSPKELDVLQQPTASPQQVLALGCQFDPAADAIEQGNSEFEFKRLDLARCGRLAQMQASMRRGKAAGFRNDDEGLQVPKIHFNAHFA